MGKSKGFSLKARSTRLALVRRGLLRKKHVQETRSSRPKVDRSMDWTFEWDRESSPTLSAEQLEIEQLWKEFDYCLEILGGEVEDTGAAFNVNEDKW